MGRHKAYDRDDVLAKAVDVFWRKGFKACSIVDAVNATGLNTASMYKEFGDKDGLFGEALDHYREHNMSPRLQILRDQPNIKGVEAFLDDVIKSAASENYKGCLMMNHLAQRNTISPQAAKKIDDYSTTIEGLLEVAIRNAQASDESDSGKDPAVLASYIVCCIHGLILYGRHPSRQSEIHGLRNVILQSLA